jgi:GNAT superfamily N-acetyltransferase
VLKDSERAGRRKPVCPFSLAYHHSYVETQHPRGQAGDEQAIHDAHMRSIREVCVQDHGEEEVRGWGNRPLGERWKKAIAQGFVWVVEHEGAIHGHAYIRILDEGSETKGHIHGLYLTPEVLGKGLGRRLAELMLEKARRAGAGSVTLDSSLTAHGFYQHLGFRDSGPMKRQDIGGSLVRGYPMAIQLR